MEGCCVLAIWARRSSPKYRNSKKDGIQWVGIHLVDGGAYQPNWEDKAAASELYDWKLILKKTLTGLTMTTTRI